MFTLVFLALICIVTIIASLKMYNQLSYMQRDISDIKKDNERRIQYNKERNEARKKQRRSTTEADRQVARRIDAVSKMQSVDKRSR